ncbi:acyltransferase family protein [Hyalangium rubrum]|uniref:Acyltransferase n=1 Tax=Hyalangium rubrum TaxID=3103134 RepID=A0ABU5H0M0_9BACT|nr:acyltransferase [Hyalangium sp. s54d21]MDY7226998.1 acyltransferase [Hyalangium sp. s54d21]
MRAAAEARQDGLDVLRAVAILLVLCFHSPEAVRNVLPPVLVPAFTLGWMGVDLFFVLSGYLIGRQVFATREDLPLGARLRTFWVKRWTRTLPLYLVVLGTYAVLKPLVFKAPFLGGGWHFALFLQNYSALRDFVQSWSLCVEEHFYLVLPLLAFGLRGQRWPAWVWLMPMAVSVLGRALLVGVIPSSPPVREWLAAYPWGTHLHLDGLSVGVFLARTAPRWRTWPARWKAASTVLGLGVLAVTLGLYGATVLGHTYLGLYPGLSAGFGLLLVGMESWRLPTGPRRAVYAVAVTSYGAYLWHGLLVRVFERSHFTLGIWALDLLVFFAATLLVSWVTYVAIEKPGLRLRNWLLAREEPGQVPGKPGYS